MKQKSDAKKIQEGRCLGTGDRYVGFIKANEIGSIGTSTAVYDPIAERTVDTLSMGEKEFFWIMRYRDDVKLIQEQMMLSSETVRNICEEHGFRVLRNVLSTDFLITFRNDSRIAYSIKSGAEEFNPDSPKYQTLLVRQCIEMEYWTRYGIDFRIVLRENLNKTLAVNIEHCMAYYDPAHVQSEEAMLKYLVAHKAVSIPMDRESIRFAGLVKGNEEKIRETYRRYRDGK
ncbi:TnsA endonuclease N-terminal domain-containing protein [Brotaphodocola catenula]|uniref:TnsA endonuclease N-terminal domain-containing protein n=1 Tax=Brotaphodocola catenula TaxID=2885361 RepID=A0AAE3ARI7_9FIRM|nr:TnsA endonuclease N-terminal domain-containing protein [Brotaphodocola catenula]MCC2165491.1 TnsA endonuclease N-terminal domain-containing protein [Brotaphodocola catenula]